MEEEAPLDDLENAGVGGEEHYVVYLGGNPRISLKGPLCDTTTSKSLEFNSAWFSTFKSQHFKIPLTKLKGANFESKRQISGWSLFFLGLLKAYLFKEKKNFVVIEYEDNGGQTQKLVFNMWHQDLDDKEKIKFIRDVNSTLIESLRKPTQD